MLALRRSYLGSIVIPLEITIAGGQPKYLSLKYLSSAANSLISGLLVASPLAQALGFHDNNCFRLSSSAPLL